MKLEEKERIYLQELVNDELKNYLDDGYFLNDDYVIALRNIIEKLGLRETYPFDKWYKKEVKEND